MITTAQLIQQTLNSGSVQVQFRLALSQKFSMVSALSVVPARNKALRFSSTNHSGEKKKIVTINILHIKLFCRAKLKNRLLNCYFVVYSLFFSCFHY